MRFAVTYVEALKIQAGRRLRTCISSARSSGGRQSAMTSCCEPYRIPSARRKKSRACIMAPRPTESTSPDDELAIAPGPDEDDLDGCEDPTLAIVDATHYVYYTGWNERRKRGELLLAAGRSAAFGKARRSTAIANGLRKPQGSHDRAVRGRHVAADDWRSRDVLQRREPQSRTAHRLGCVDECYTRVMERCADPILAPPAERGPDKDMYCATLRRLQPGR